MPFVDLSRYEGKWYEIARYPTFFQRQCAGDVTAEYSSEADGSIRVVNRCRTTDGRFDEAIGTATVVPGSGNARLRVSFGVPFIRGDYWIIALDDDYQWALVGHPSRKYLWILSRAPEMPEDTFEQIVNRAVLLGYDRERIERTSQSGAD